jgi:hypothetical protein
LGFGHFATSSGLRLILWAGGREKRQRGEEATSTKHLHVAGHLSSRRNATRAVGWETTTTTTTMTTMVRNNGGGEVKRVGCRGRERIELWRTSITTASTNRPIEFGIPTSASKLDGGGI